MKILKKISIVLALMFVAVIPVVTVKTQEASAASTLWLGTFTGYTKASDVKYNTSGSYLANWGAREEDCIFLSNDAQKFYTGSYTYDTLSKQAGGSSQSNAHNSVLYSSLKTLMSSKQSKKTSYDGTKEMYRYTDCVNGDSSYISSFYSGTRLNGKWDSAATWNREHAWPKSKSLNGNNNGGDDESDIMMLRPTWVEENSSRGNTAYGQSSGYYDPNGEGSGKVNLRGDCARIFLHTYVRWGNTSYAWGKSGVMESMDVLLQWMEEDPVDTWEMGRNDVVEDITGTRNVFVDYPEYAWLLFGKTAPDDMPTPSGKASNGEAIGNAGSGSSGGNTGDNSGSGDNSGDITDTPTYSTPAEILNALYGLNDGQTISGSFTLTGKITDIDEHKNPTIVVTGFENKPVYCYRLVLDDAKVGDILTVTASTMKNYQGKYEFMNITSHSIQSDGNNSGGNSGNTGSDAVAGSLAKFEFGANGSATHADGNDLSTAKYTENGYTLSLTGMSKVYGPAYDAKGNSCIKLGAGSAAGSFNFTVGNEVDQVKFEIAKYKDKASKVKINGVEHTLTKNSDNGEYDVITIDTTSTKTVTVTTLSGGYRVMINSIEFISLEESGNGNSGNIQPDDSGNTQPEDSDSGNTSVPDDSSVNGSGTASGDNTSSGSNSEINVTISGCESSISLGGAVIGLAVLVGTGIAIKKGKKED
jgi:endonuclease I